MYLPLGGANHRPHLHDELRLRRKHSQPCRINVVQKAPQGWSVPVPWSQSVF